MEIQCNLNEDIQLQVPLKFTNNKLNNNKQVIVKYKIQISYGE